MRDFDSSARSRLSLLSAAFVIARRDFTAILFSKAFLLFLIGPLFFIGISGAAGALGAQAARSADSGRQTLTGPPDRASSRLHSSRTRSRGRSPASVGAARGAGGARAPA